jgi:hypothetical protein
MKQLHRISRRYKLKHQYKAMTTTQNNEKAAQGMILVRSTTRKLA